MTFHLIELESRLKTSTSIKYNDFLTYPLTDVMLSCDQSIPVRKLNFSSNLSMNTTEQKTDVYLTYAHCFYPYFLLYS